MSGTLRTLPFAKTFVEIVMAWLAGSTAASVMYMPSWDKVAELPLAIADALAWFLLLILPLLLLAWPLLTVLRSRLRPNVPSLLVLGAMFAIAVFGLTRPETSDPYSQPIYRILGATGFIWVVWVAADVFYSRRRRSNG